MWNGMLIDFGDALRLSEVGYGRGTRPYKGIGVDLGGPNSFINDVESFFWALFWICIYREGPVISNRIVIPFDEWYYLDGPEVAVRKRDVVRDEVEFLRIAEKYFNAYHRPLTPWVNKLRQIVFPNGEPRTELDPSICDAMAEILKEAESDKLVRNE
ncbi:hypothetical protein IFR04_006163 [Cadophora malorum]|uniref:Fungal-type protein kinase domain-containing protein n=1 Tax=Cadophora malorum TaxID=108018 RepID=A0A8H7TFH5_9HELO|nr:hypothetical protein IFR04_006163 [Cadophora malorum]